MTKIKKTATKVVERTTGVMRRLPWVETQYRKPEHNQEVLAWNGYADNDGYYFIAQYDQEHNIFSVKVEKDSEYALMEVIEGMEHPDFWLPLVTPYGNWGCCPTNNIDREWKFDRKLRNVDDDDRD